MKTLFILFAGFLLFIAFALIPPKHNFVGHWKIAMKKTFKTIFKTLVKEIAEEKIGIKVISLFAVR